MGNDRGCTTWVILFSSLQLSDAINHLRDFFEQTEFCFSEGQRIFENVESLRALLLELEEPINRSATQLQDLHDDLKGK